MTTQQYFRITEILKRNNFADKDVEQLLGEVENIASPLATKEDIKDLTTKDTILWIIALISKDYGHAEIKEILRELTDYRRQADMKEFLKEMNDYRRFFRAELKQSTADTMKRMVALIVSQTAVIVGILYFMLHRP